MAASIEDLPWVQDGFEGSEFEAAENLLYIAVLSRTVASSIVSFDWVQDGVDAGEAEALGWVKDFGSAAVAASVVSLDWVAGGIDEIESKAIEQLSYMDYWDTKVASSVVSLGWVADGMNDIEVKAIEHLAYMAYVDAEVASSVVSLGWVADDMSDIEVKVIEQLSRLAVDDGELASSVVSLGWVQDGVDDLEAETIGRVNYFGSVEVALSVVALGWVEDGIEEIEVKAIRQLAYIDHWDAKVASSVISLGWVEDGIEALEMKAIDQLAYIVNWDSEIASSVVSLGWVQDGIEALEMKAIEQVANMAHDDGEVALSVVALGWVEDGVEAGEFEVIEQLSGLALDDGDLASAVVSSGWVQDGVDDVEAETIGWVKYFGSVEVALSVVALGWVEDGVEAREFEVIEGLSYIAKGDPGAALRITGMPFLETIEPPDVSAVTSLSRLASFAPEAFAIVMSKDLIRGGISDDLAPIVATLYRVTKTNPALIDVLLDNSRVTLEQRDITLPLAGNVSLSIIRTTPGATTLMDLLEHSLRGVEEFMSEPLPTSHVVVLYEEAVSGSNAGVNHGTHIAIIPAYDTDDESHESTFAGHNNAHEVAHYYWSGNEDWVDEGAAELMASIIDGARSGHPAVVTNPPCGHAANLAELEVLGASRGDAEFGCNYSLGERLFVDLYLTAGDERFRQGFRDLYLASEIEDEVDDLPGTAVGIEHVREAFGADDGLESVVISRWYDGTEPYDLSRLDTGPVDPILPSINGRIEKAYVITSLDGPAVTTFSAQDVGDWVYIALEYAYRVSSGPREVPLEIVEFYEDGFEFRRRSADVTAETQFIGGTAWFSVGPAPPRKWAPGRYWVYVYAGEQKVAEVSYEVTP